jgi:hypothetical protein
MEEALSPWYRRAESTASTTRWNSLTISSAVGAANMRPPTTIATRLKTRAMVLEKAFSSTISAFSQGEWA